MQDRIAMTHDFAFSLGTELCRPSSQRPGAAHRPWLDSLNEATRRQHLHYKFLQGSWNLSEYAQQKLSWLRESCPAASLARDGTIAFSELTGSDAEPYFSVSMPEPIPTPQSCPCGVSSCPDSAARIAPLAGGLRGTRETARRYEPSGAASDVRGRQQCDGVTARRLVARPCRSRAKNRRQSTLP